MMAAADATTDLRVGALVFDNDYKHPVVLAKEIATIDVLSGGRVEFGIGAGWMNTDYEQSGIPKDRDGVRIARMVEALDDLQGPVGAGAVQLQGRALHDHRPRRAAQAGAAAAPADPHRRRRPEGARASPRSTPTSSASTRGSTAGEVTADAGHDATRQRASTRRSQWVRDAAGDRFDDLELNILVVLRHDHRRRAWDRREPRRRVRRHAPTRRSSCPYAWFGTVDEICDKLRAARERWGISYFVLQKDGMDAMAPVVAELAGT